MKLMVNGEQIEEELPSKSTLAAALQSVEDNHVAGNEVILNVMVDDEPLTAERLSIWKDRPVNEFKEIRVELKSRNSLAGESLRLIAERLKDTASQREKIGEHLGQGRVQEAMEIMPGYIQVWNAVQQNLAAAARLLGIEIDTLEVFDQSDLQSPQVQSVADRIDQLAKQLDQIKSALEAGDLVLLGDILDYEFSELTSSWHNMLLQLADQFEPKE